MATLVKVKLEKLFITFEDVRPTRIFYVGTDIMDIIFRIKEGKVHPCTGTEALYRP